MSWFLIASDDRLHELPADKNVLLGRAPVNAIVLNDRLVSRVHAGITPSPKGPVLTDRGSANGTQVNGLARKETILYHGDSVRIGKFLFHVFSGTRADAEKWMTRRKSDTRTDKTMTELNVNQLRPADMLGDLSAFNIVHLLQTLVDQKRHGALTLTQRGELLGKIYLTNGMIVFAESSTGLKGREAFFELVATQHGAFTFQADVSPPAMAILEAPVTLLLEGCRRYDEARAAVLRQ